MEEQLKLPIIGDDLENSGQEDIMPPPDTFSYSESRSVADIYRMLQAKSIEKQPKYQRPSKWTDYQKSRFIDSLYKRMPIPSICFSVNHNEEYQTIDGQQRIRTINEFLSGELTIKDLDDISEVLRGETVNSLELKDPKALEKISNVTLPITMLKCDYNNEQHMTYIYNIFSRLNTAGTKLEPQEIRHALYQSPFSDFLQEIKLSEEWQNNIFIAEEFKSLDSYSGEELILGLLGTVYNLDQYGGKWGLFLNDFMMTCAKRSQDKTIINKYNTPEYGNFKDSLYKVLNILNNAGLLRKEYHRSKIQTHTLLDSMIYNIENINQISENIELYLSNFYKLPEIINAYKDGGTHSKAKLTSRIKKARGLEFNEQTNN